MGEEGEGRRGKWGNGEMEKGKKSKRGRGEEGQKELKIR